MSRARRRGAPCAGRVRIGAALAVALLGGCTTDQGVLAIAAPYAVPLDTRRMDFDALPVVGDVEGRHTAVTSILFVPTGAGPRLGDAVADAVERGHGDVLTRARVTTTKWWLGIGVETIRVRGNVIDVPEVP